MQVGSESEIRRDGRLQPGAVDERSRPALYLVRMLIQILRIAGSGPDIIGLGRRRGGKPLSLLAIAKPERRDKRDASRPTTFILTVEESPFQPALALAQPL